MIAGYFLRGLLIGLIVGILVGTLCWWSALSGVVAYFRKKVTDHIYKRLNRILGCLMALDLRIFPESCPKAVLRLSKRPDISWCKDKHQNVFPV